MDLKTRLTAPTGHQCLTQGLQLLPTPDSSMLVVLGYDGAGWTLEVLSLDERTDPPLFHTVKDRQPLPLLGQMPEVRKCQCPSWTTACKVA